MEIGRGMRGECSAGRMLGGARRSDDWAGPMLFIQLACSGVIQLACSGAIPQDIIKANEGAGQVPRKWTRHRPAQEMPQDHV